MLRCLTLISAVLAALAALAIGAGCKDHSSPGASTPASPKTTAGATERSAASTQPAAPTGASDAAEPASPKAEKAPECTVSAECADPLVCRNQRCAKPRPSAYPDPETIDLVVVPDGEGRASTLQKQLEEEPRSENLVVQDMRRKPAIQEALATVLGRLEPAALRRVMELVSRPVNCALPGGFEPCVFSRRLARALTRLLGHPSPRIRFQALRSLRMHTGPRERAETLRYVLHVIESDPNDLVRTEGARRFFFSEWIPTSAKHPVWTRLAKDPSRLLRAWTAKLGEPRVPPAPWDSADPRDRYHSIDYWALEGRSFLGATCRDHELALRRAAEPDRKMAAVSLDDLDWAPLACTEIPFKRCFLTCDSLKSTEGSVCGCPLSDAMKADLKLTRGCLARVFELAEQAEPPNGAATNLDEYRGKLRAMLKRSTDSLNRRCNDPTVARCVAKATDARQAAFGCTGGLTVY